MDNMNTKSLTRKTTDMFLTSLEKLKKKVEKIGAF